MQQLEIKVDENGSLLKSDTPLKVSKIDFQPHLRISNLSISIQVGCVLSGGQAAGGHNVIMGLFDMVRKLHPESKLYGFLAGPHGVFSNNYQEITPEFMALYRNTGGFDMIRKCSRKSY